MAVLKCKMCGGDLRFEAGASTCECEYCGSINTIPKVDTDQEMNLFNRANHFRMANDFDRAIQAYEKILDMDDTNAEAHWGIVLSRYGIEYVEDPSTHERIPTCHRVQLTSILSDPDYLAALEHADVFAAKEYKIQAERIAQIQKGILDISSKEKPYDVFICYKESDDNGRRTVDSTLAQDIYYGLTESGYRVFFSRITLEDKLGQEYEPYIFAALNSAKVMVVVGTKPEYFNAVWVKNEWSRFLDLMKKDRSRLLIPCYRGMNPYDLPDELSMLQSQDMSKIGFMQDLLRGIRKVLAKEAPKQTKTETVNATQSYPVSSATAQIKRGNMALEDHDWSSADSFFEEALNIDPESAQSYIGKLLARDKEPDFESWVMTQKNKYSKASQETLYACDEDTDHIVKMVHSYVLDGYLDARQIRKELDFDRSYLSELSCRQNQREQQLKELADDRLLYRARQHGKGAYGKQIEDGIAEIKAVLDQRVTDAQNQDNENIERIKAEYAQHIAQADKRIEELNQEAHNNQEKDYQNAVGLFNNAKDAPDFKKAEDALKAMKGYKDSTELAQKSVQCKAIDEDYVKAVSMMDSNSVAELNNAISIFNKNPDWKDSKDKIQICSNKILSIKRAQEKKKRNGIIAGAVVAVVIAAVLLVTQFIIPGQKYNTAMELMNDGKYEEAVMAFSEIEGFKDSREKLEECFKIATGYDYPEVGSTISFGTYEQDNEQAVDEEEDIKWKVLAVEGNKFLVVSEMALDARPYNEQEEDVTWETCTLRDWLNEDFLDAAFTKQEQKFILTTTVTADKNPEYSTNPGNDTEDKVFLLSVSEAEKYFSSDSDRQVKATEYAKENGAYFYGSNGNSWWWLRSPGYISSCAAAVRNDGSIRCDGYGVDDDRSAVRPALWLGIDN
ncbi:MAG: TIR domain-containing protein [Faecalicoccus sp.]|nr:TIR domain-containing protein [Faecalicoccus sp.]